jgi:hypothetical protein
VFTAQLKVSKVICVALASVMKIPLSVLEAGSAYSGWQAQVQGLIYNSLQVKEQDTLEKFKRVAYYKVIVHNSFIKFTYIDVTIYIY